MAKLDKEKMLKVLAMSSIYREIYKILPNARQFHEISIYRLISYSIYSYFDTSVSVYDGEYWYRCYALYDKEDKTIFIEVIKEVPFGDYDIEL